MIACRCGHERPLADLRNSDCPACRDQKRREKARKKREKQEADRQARKDKGLLDDDGRLPDRSRFVATYAANPQPEWTVTLELATGKYFEARGPSLEKTERECARLYREWASQPAIVEGQPD